MADLIFPTIHMNGTSARTLLEDQCNAMAAVRNAISVLHNTGPNARDYYPKGPEFFRVAADQHSARIQKLQDVLRELEQIAEYIADQP